MNLIFAVILQISLNELVSEALQNSPQIRAAMERWEASKHIPSQVKTLPDPLIGISLGMMKQAQISQPIPFPLKLKKRGEIAETESLRSFWEFEATKWGVIRKLKVNFFELWFLWKQREIFLEMKGVFKDLEDSARIRYEVGKGILQDVLRAQLEISRIEEKLLLVNAQIEKVEAEINAILGRPPFQKLERPEEVDSLPLKITLDELESIALKKSPLMKVALFSREANEERLALARLDYIPNFRIGAGWMFEPKAWNVMIGVEIPLYFWWKEREAVKEASHRLLSSEHLLFDVKQKVLSRVRALFELIKTSFNLVKLYETTIIPQARYSFESARSAYAVGKVDFYTVLESALVLLMYEIEHSREISTNRKFLAELEEITGTELDKRR